MDRHTGGEGDSYLLVYISSFHQSKGGQRSVALESALLINKEAACLPVCLLVFLSVSLAAHLRTSTNVSTRLPVKIFNAFLDFIGPSPRPSLYAISVFLLCFVSISVSYLL